MPSSRTSARARGEKAALVAGFERLLLTGAGAHANHIGVAGRVARRGELVEDPPAMRVERLPPLREAARPQLAVPRRTAAHHAGGVEPREDLSPSRRAAAGDHSLRRSIELGESLGPEDPSLADPLTSLGAARRGVGDPDEAVPLLTRALGLREKQPGDAAELAETRFALAQALWSRVDRRAQARDLATQARDGYASRGEVYAEDTQRVAHWLQTHRP